MADIKFIVEVDSKKGQASIKELDKQVGKLPKTTQKAAGPPGGFKALWLQIGLGVAAVQGVIRSIRGLINWVGDAVDKAGIQELVEKEVAAALQSTGREVESNTEFFKKYASQIQQATVYGDEQVLSSQAMLIQLTNLDRDGLSRATKGAIGLASVYKTDLKAATVLVGKALAGNYGALSRYGIMVERSMTDEQKRASILAQLEIMYKRAEAETDTYQGAVKQLSNTYGDLKEKIGDAVIKNEQIRETIKKVREEIEEFIKTGKLDQWAADTSLYIDTAIKTHKGFWGALKKANRAIEEFIGAVPKAKDGTDEYTEAVRKLHEALERAGRPLITGVSAIDETGEAAIRARTKIERLSLPVKQLETDWESLVDTVQEPELTLAWQQFEIESQNTFTNVTKGLGIFVEETSEKAGEYKEIISGMTEAQKEFSALAQEVYWGMETNLKSFVASIMSTFERWAIGQIIPKIITALPFPANLIAIGPAMLVIKKIFAELKGSKEKGGFIREEGMYYLHTGETVIPANKTMNIYNQTTGGSKAVFNFYSPLVTTTKEVNGEKLFREMEREARRKGYKLLRN